MQSVVTGIILTIVISAIAWAVWETQTTTSADRFTAAENVRLH